MDKTKGTKLSCGKNKLKCRCCAMPSDNFMQITSVIKTSEEEGMEKTYKEFLYEITKQKLSSYQENNMPQQICQKCSKQLKISYKFIQQACKITQLYLKQIDDEPDHIPEDIKNIEQLEETLIEIKTVTSNQSMQDKIKVEPLSIECNVEIKEEQEPVEENEIYIPIIENKEEDSLEERDFLNNDNSNEPAIAASSSSSSSENGDNSDDMESLKDFESNINEKSLARSCDICHKVYRNEKFLNIHKRYTHIAEEDKIPCPLCSYKANRNSALKTHMGLMHGKDKVEEYFKPLPEPLKKYPCNFCTRSYDLKDSLRSHIKHKHLNKPSPEDAASKIKPPKPKEKESFLCTYCGQSFSTKRGLKSHMLIHTEERPFTCDICNKGFKRLKDLQLHRVIHSDEKPHQCSECGKGFKRVDKLKLHMRVHSELRPYKCNECEKTFKYPSVLKTHMLIHTGQPSLGPLW